MRKKKMLFRVKYDQQFNDRWCSYEETIIAPNDAKAACDKLVKIATGQTLDKHVCTGVRIISIVPIAQIDNP